MRQVSTFALVAALAALGSSPVSAKIAPLYGDFATSGVVRVQDGGDDPRQQRKLQRQEERQQQKQENRTERQQERKQQRQAEQPRKEQPRREQQAEQPRREQPRREQQAEQPRREQPRREQQAEQPRKEQPRREQAEQPRRERTAEEQERRQQRREERAQGERQTNRADDAQRQQRQERRQQEAQDAQRDQRRNDAADEALRRQRQERREQQAQDAAKEQRRDTRAEDALRQQRQERRQQEAQDAAKEQRRDNRAEDALREQRQERRQEQAGDAARQERREERRGQAGDDQSSDRNQAIRERLRERQNGVDGGRREQADDATRQERREERRDQADDAARQERRDERRQEQAGDGRERLERRNEVERASREELAERNQRAERRAEQLRPRRDELRRELQDDRRDARREDLRREQERGRDWEERQIARMRENQRDMRRDIRDLQFFDRGRRIGNTNRYVHVYNGRPIVVNVAPERFRWRANAYDVYELNGGWRQTVVVRDGGVRVVTISDAYGVPIRRYREIPGGPVVTLFNNRPEWWGDDADVIVNVDAPRVTIPREEYIVEPSRAPVNVVYNALSAPPVQQVDRTYTLNQVLLNQNVRDYMPRVDLDTITFATGSAEVPENQVDQLEEIGVAIEQAVKDNAAEVFLIEGHTDAVGSEESNLVLSDARAESVADLLTQYFEIPPENIVTQGFGEQFLKVQTDGPSQENRRVTVRRITPLLSTDDQIAGLEDDTGAN